MSFLRVGKPGRYAEWSQLVRMVHALWSACPSALPQPVSTHGRGSVYQNLVSLLRMAHGKGSRGIQGRPLVFRERGRGDLWLQDKWVDVSTPPALLKIIVVRAWMFMCEVGYNRAFITPSYSYVYIFKCVIPWNMFIRKCHLQNMCLHVSRSWSKTPKMTSPSFWITVETEQK